MLMMAAWGWTVWNKASRVISQILKPLSPYCFKTAQIVNENMFCEATCLVEMSFLGIGEMETVKTHVKIYTNNITKDNDVKH